MAKAKERIDFGELKDAVDIPDLIEIQLQSYEDFLQLRVSPEKRIHQGLQEIFEDTFPLRDPSDNQSALEFVKYDIREPKIGIVDCLKDGGTYQAPVYVTFRLRCANSKDIQEAEIFMGEIPMMTPGGSFVINGAERVIVSQLHRSPGVCFESNHHASGKELFSFKIIADHGSWLEVQFDVNDFMYIYLDRKRRRRKFLISTFLRAFGYDSNREILSAIYTVEDVQVRKLVRESRDSDIAKVYTADDVKDSDGEVIVPALESLNDNILEHLTELGIKKIPVARTGQGGDYFIRCLQKDMTVTCEDAQREIYRRMRPSDPPNASNARALFHRMFQDVRRYDLGYVGRFKMNQRLNINVDEKIRVLTKDDVAAAIRCLMELRNGHGIVDDIDHLGRRRLRTVGELLQNQCRLALLRVASYSREHLEEQDKPNAEKNIAKVVNGKIFTNYVRDFFGRNQLSQFMDQTNCLAELTNKRRLSALGPGGLTRDHAGYDVRDVHSSHYGRICPIETPEGPNIGLISSLALYGRIDSFGFIKTPYNRVVDCKPTGEILYLTADEEEQYVIAQANAPRGKDGRFSEEYVLGRKNGESGEFPREEVEFIDVSPKQLISAAAGLIPFLEHDDANRALMGSNMQRQAVPLLKPERPLVGTGLEHYVARDSRCIVVAREAGIVASATGDRIIVTSDGKLPEETSAPDKVQVYNLYKFLRSNASTLVNQHPIVHRGEAVEKGQTLADGACTDQGDLALGRNVMVAFMPWRGYNFEDAIIISERLVQEDVYTSVHVSLEDVTARETKMGPEEITRDIPNVSEDELRNLDTEGVIRIGAEVKPGDILVGKITPKNEPELAPEERLLKAIFGEKASDVKDSSLKMSSGSNGIVMDIRIERRADPTQAKMTKQQLKERCHEVELKFRNEQSAIIEDMVKELSNVFLGAKLSTPVQRVVNGETEEIIPADRKITKMTLNRLANSYDTYQMKDCDEKNRIENIMRVFRIKIRDNEQRKGEELELVNRSEGQEPAKIVSVKVYIASKRRISIGDKMAGRHGNKGIVSKIVPVADLPFMADGTPVDIILNPLGVPSRMNVGQVFETHAGWAAKILGMTIATPVFDGIQEKTIFELLDKARRIKVAEAGYTFADDGRIVDKDGRDRSEEFVGLDGKTRLYDGFTGEPFAQRVVVGQIYMLKLDHLVVNKIHARSTGPYSLVTQQPLGGKAQHGGQRFGEMEVWALEAYGAAYTLQEMLTVKSDDVQGRTKIYDSIMKGSNELIAGTPESFNVLMREMMSLCLDVRVKKNNNAMA